LDIRKRNKEADEEANFSEAEVTHDKSAGLKTTNTDGSTASFGVSSSPIPTLSD